MLNKLSRNEAILLIICLLVFFILANLMFLRPIISGIKTSYAKIEQKESVIEQHNIVLEEASNWQDKVNWIENNIPVLEKSKEITQAELEQSMRESIDKQGFTFGRPPISPSPIEEEGIVEISIQYDLKGDLFKLERWASSLQNHPKEFFQIKSFKLALDPKSKGSTPQGKCAITISKWYKNKDQA